MKIENYSNYIYCMETDTITNVSTGKILKESVGKKGSYFKLKNDLGKWVSVTKNMVMDSLGFCILSEDYKEIPNFPNYFINENAEIISFGLNKKTGKKLIVGDRKKEYYITVGIRGKTIGVHQLMAITFIDKDYLEKGLCVLHLDNDKHNNKLSNLKVGTYSENNLQAYKDGLNKGNGLKK